jgi:PAS domain S-box-containing protein
MATRETEGRTSILERRIDTPETGPIETGELSPRWRGAEGLRLLVEAAPIAIVAVDTEGRIRLVNRHTEAMFGYRREEIVGRSLERLIPARHREAHIAHRAEYSLHPRERSMGTGHDLRGLRSDGSEFPIEAGLSHVELGGESITLGSIVDITHRKQIEETLERRVEERTREIDRRRQVAAGLRDTLAALNSDRSLEEILDHVVTQARRLLEASASGIYQLDAGDGRLSVLAQQGLPGAFLSRAEDVVGDCAIQRAVVQGRPVAVGDLSGEARNEPDGRSRRDALLSSGYQAVLAVPLWMKDSVFGGLELYYDEPHAFTEEEIGLAATFGDQVALAIENARLRAHFEREAVQAERSRIARDLHDSVTQTLFSASMIGEVLPSLWARDADEGRRRLEEIRQLTRGALAEMRTLLLELRPQTLDEVPLIDLIQQLVEAARGRARLPIEAQLYCEEDPPAEVKEAVFRIAQESLNNVARHARAGEAALELHCGIRSTKGTLLSVHDDGIGFDTAAVGPDHLGLSIMRERAEAIGAELKVESEPGKGTRIRFHWQPAGTEEVVHDQT